MVTEDVPKENITLSAFMPFHNEEQNVRRAVETAIDAIRGIPCVSDYEVIMVDDGSTDKTNGIARELVSKYGGRVGLVAHSTNLGYGAAVLSGIGKCRYDYVFFTDGDCQFDLNEITKLLEWVPEYDAVIGYRARRVESFQRKLNAWLWNRLIRVLFGIKVKDIDCAFKLFKRRLFTNLNIKSRGAMFSAELLVKLKRAGTTMKEIPVSHLPRRYGETSGAKLKVIMKAFKELKDFYFSKQ